MTVQESLFTSLTQTCHLATLSITDIAVSLLSMCPGINCSTVWCCVTVRNWHTHLEVILPDGVLGHLLAQGLLASVIIGVPGQLHIGVLQGSCGEVRWGVISRHLLCGVAYLPPSKALQKI